MSTPRSEQAAFPKGTAATGQRGLTVREYMAALAMQSIAAYVKAWPSDSPQAIAGEAVKLADALIARLAQPRFGGT